MRHYVANDQRKEAGAVILIGHRRNLDLSDHPEIALEMRPQ